MLNVKHSTRLCKNTVRQLKNEKGNNEKYRRIITVCTQELGLLAPQYQPQRKKANLGR